MSTAQIRAFSGEYRFLSNYYPAPTRINGIVYPTTEHAFAAFKTLDHRIRQEIASKPTPGNAKRAGRRVALRADWEAVKWDVMLAILRAKFRQHPDLAAKLVATGDALLVEGNTWGDRVWGVDLRTGVGENGLGLALMRVRRELAASGLPAPAPASKEWSYP